jgi:hypothetical protein
VLSLEPTTIGDRSTQIRLEVDGVTVIWKLRKPRVQTMVSMRAKKQAVKGLEAEAYPMLKNSLLSKPICTLLYYY